MKNSKSNIKKYFSIDGSYGEGGGSILRLSAAFSVLTKKPIRIYNIRKNRPKPGLRTQHLVGLESLAELSQGKLSDVKVGTTEIFFDPNEIKTQTLDINIKTAGSIGLLLQAIQIACINNKNEIQLNVKGGATFGKWAPTILYIQNITLKILEKMGYRTEIDIIKDGFYPKGGAQARIIIKPTKEFNPIQLIGQGNIKEINGISIASNFLRKQKVAERQAKVAKRRISNKLNFSCFIKTKYVDTLSPGSGICIWLKTDSGVILGADNVGERGIPAEKVGQKCADFLINTYQSKATCDTFLSDQLLPYMAMVTEGKSEFLTSKFTNHAKTNIWLLEQFINKKFLIEQRKNLVKISCCDKT
ncbi:MAG: RNA 3'-terminal phosphate cyclase [Candidatus Hodarchaeota archaeon]